MEMRIVAQNSASATSLAEQLTAELGAGRIALSDDHRQVGIQIEGEWDRAVLQVLDAAARWLDQDAAGSADAWLGERS